MRKLNVIIIASLAVFLTLCIAVPQGWSGLLQPSVSPGERAKARAAFDDPRPLYKQLDWKKLTTKEWVDKMTVNPDEAKKAWSDCVGFKAPDVVGKIAPEIKPGVYNYTDKDKYPGLKQLMIPYLWEKFKPAGTPFPANFREVKIIPTRQYYWQTAFSELTKKNEGKTKQDDKGYILWKTFDGGIPWPKPAGANKAMQIMYNQLYSQQPVDDMFLLILAQGLTKDLKQDYDSQAWGGQLKLHGRITPPVGWYDERAKTQGEQRNRGFLFLSPRDNYGMVIGITEYLDPARWTNQKVYIPGLRRVRTLSSTDTQDVNPGAPDSLYDDTMGFGQKMSPTVFPMSYKIVEEREFLVPAYWVDGSAYYTSPAKGVELMNQEWERRPVYVVELTELDKNYVYSKRVLYIDKETFQLHLGLMYDRKGRLYRAFWSLNQFNPENGQLSQGVQQLMIDHIDSHTTINQAFTYGDPSRINRSLGSIEALKLTK